METDGSPKAVGKKNFVVSRFSMPNDPASSMTEGASPKWQGYHELKEEEIDKLAQAIVRQVKARGPFRSLAEFVNRRLGSESDERSQFGALQAALEDPDVSINEPYRSPTITSSDLQQARYQNKSAALGPRFQGAPPYVNQADLLNVIGPVLNARSDSFPIRGYGEARDISGNVTARARCEAVVKRFPEYVDTRNVTTASSAELSVINQSFGRRFRIVSFRWLASNDV